MSGYNSSCGVNGWPSPVLPNEVGQLSGGAYANLQGDVTVYQNMLQKPQSPYPPKFKSAADYIRFKKAQILSSPLSGVYKDVRPPPSSYIVTDICEPPS